MRSVRLAAFGRRRRSRRCTGRCTGRSRATSTVESSRPLSTISGGNPGHRGVAKHSGPQGNSGTAMFARSGTVSSPGALAVSSPERVRRAHRFLIKAASKSVDRAGSRDQAMRIGVTANVGGDLRRSTVFRRSTRGPPIRRSQSPFGVMRNALCPIGLSGSIRHSDENGSPLRYHRSPGHVGQSVVKDVARRSMCLIPSASTVAVAQAGPSRARVA